MRLKLRRHQERILLNFILISGFVLFQMCIDLPPRQELLFSTPDSITYLDVANWISHGTPTESTSVRPILYPLFLSIFLKLTGNMGIIIIQSALWLLTVNLVFSSIKRLTKNILFACIGCGIIAINLSLLSLTAHALTEVTTVFLLSLLVYLITLKRESFREPGFILTILLMLVLLTLVKPIFFLPIILVVFVLIPLFHFKRLLLQRRLLFTLLLILTPLLCQMTWVASKHGHFSVSTIGSLTFSRYIVAQGIIQIEGLEYQNAVDKAEKFSTQEKLNYLKQNALTYSKIFFKNIKGNIQGAPTFLSYPIENSNPKPTAFMKKYNNTTLYLHFIFLIIALFTIIQLWRTSRYPLMIMIVILFVLNSYLIVMTGISYWQGDRLTLPAIALWSVLYPVLSFYVIQKLKNQKQGLITNVQFVQND